MKLSKHMMKYEELLFLLKASDTVDAIDSRREEIAEIIPIVRSMFDYDQMNPAHQYDLWMHSLHTVCGLPRGLEDDMVYLAALLHDIRKPDSRCRSSRENDMEMHYYGHPEKSAQIVESQIVPLLQELGLTENDGERLIYYVKYHDDRVSVKLKHVRRHIKMVPFEQFRYLIQLQVADAKAHVQLPIIAERVDICTRLAGEEGQVFYQRILDGE